jgi:hypothetical protein
MKLKRMYVENKEEEKMLQMLQEQITLKKRAD